MGDFGACGLDNLRSFSALTTGRSRPAVGRRGRAGLKSEERGRIYQGFMITRGRRGSRGRKILKKRRRGGEDEGGRKGRSDSRGR